MTHDAQTLHIESLGSLATVVLTTTQLVFLTKPRMHKEMCRIRRRKKKTQKMGSCYWVQAGETTWAE